MPTAKDLLKKSRFLNENKKFREVIELLTDKQLETYSSADLYSEKSQACWRLNEYECCKKTANKALEIDPINPKGNLYRGWMFWKEKAYPEAIRCYNTALKSGTNLEHPYQGLGNVYKSLKKYKKAIEFFDKAIEINPSFPYSYNSLGNTYAALEVYEKAIESYNKAIDIDPEFAFPYNGLGNVYSFLEDYQKAIEYYEKALQINPWSGNVYNGLGNVYYTLKDNEKAIEFYKKALEIDPHLLYPLNGLGNVYRSLKDYAEAMKYYNKALEIDKNYLSALNGLGIVYKNLNDYTKAIKLYSRAVKIDPGFSHSYYNRGLAYQSIEQYAKAKEDYGKYIQLTEKHPNYFTFLAKSKIEDIEKLIKDPEYSEISEIVRNIKNLLIYQEPCVTHYTGFAVAQALILKDSEFRLSEGTYLNDTSEGKEIFKFLPAFFVTSPKPNDTIAQPFTAKPFIGSFVAETKHDDLTLWRMYGKEEKEEAKGCALTFEREKFLDDLKNFLLPGNKAENSEKIDDEFSFYRVAYKKPHEDHFIIPGSSSEEDALNELMHKLYRKVEIFLRKDIITEKKDLLELLNGIAYLFKSAEYQYEHELRLVVNGTGIPKNIITDVPPLKVYINLTKINPVLKKIIFGPKVERADEWASAFFYTLDQQGFHPEIYISHLPFK